MDYADPGYDTANGSMLSKELAATPRMMSVRDNLVAKKKHLQKQMDNLDAAISALDSNPGVEKVLDKIRAVGI